MSAKDKKGIQNYSKLVLNIKSNKKIFLISAKN